MEEDGEAEGQAEEEHRGPGQVREGGAGRGGGHVRPGRGQCRRHLGGEQQQVSCVQ